MSRSATGGGSPPVGPSQPFGHGGGPAHILFARVFSKGDGARLRVWFTGGPQGEWALQQAPGSPSVNRHTLEAAIQFARDNGASSGHLPRIEKALTGAGYRL